jgi:hypothetical protein
MHISIGAAILILGLLFLATSPSGRMVLGAVFVLIVVGVVGIFALLNQQENQQLALAAEKRAACEKKYPDDPSIKPGAALYGFREQMREDCEAGRR